MGAAPAPTAKQPLDWFERNLVEAVAAYESIPLLLGYPERRDILWVGNGWLLEA